MKKFENAFTLSEVLITLGIIGVVAAITMPSIINKTQSMILKNQFRKSYSVLLQAWKKAEYDLNMSPASCFYWAENPYGEPKYTFDKNGNVTSLTLANGKPLPSDYNGKFQDCSVLWQQMKKNLKIIKTCNSKAFANGCIPSYKGRDDIALEKNPSMSDLDLKKAMTSCTNTSKQNITNSWNAFVLNDGTIFLTYIDSRFFAIDVNGMKGPNKWCYDVFSFVPRGTSQGGMSYFLSGCGLTESGGLTTELMIINK